MGMGPLPLCIGLGMTRRISSESEDEITVRIVECAVVGRTGLLCADESGRGRMCVDILQRRCGRDESPERNSSELEYLGIKPAQTRSDMVLVSVKDGVTTFAMATSASAVVSFHKRRFAQAKPASRLTHVEKYV